MTEFNNGDRVNVEFEATIRTEKDGAGFSVVAPSKSTYWLPEEYLTKLHDPLPTKDGAVIRIVRDCNYPRIFELASVGSWSGTGTNVSFGTGHIQRLANDYGFTILYAGDDE